MHTRFWHHILRPHITHHQKQSISNQVTRLWWLSKTDHSFYAASRSLKFRLSAWFAQRFFASSSHLYSSSLAMSIGSSNTSNHRNGATVVTEEMEKPLSDKCSYRVIRLSNQLEATLIHDPETDKAGASLDVNVGSFSDPAETPGLAHAIEHMLFMGTEKYPQENDYNEYLAAHNGSCNAYTAYTSTNYYFEVSASDSPSSSSTSSSAQVESSTSSFYGALDRFAQFFINPLFLEDTLEREIQSVDSENKKNLQSDSWRLNQLLQSLSNPNHPHVKFSTGNWNTLFETPKKRGQNVRDEFMKLYHEEYSANRMKLVILGKESLDTLQNWVVELFSPIKDQNLPMLRWDDIPVFTEKELKHVIFAKPVIDARSLDLTFPFPNDEDFFESNPSGYLSHLIGHEGPGSILSYLKEKGWVNELSAGSEEICHGENYFNIQIRLTEDGLEKWEQVTEIVFQYISMLNDTPPLEWIFQEQKIMSEVNFRFKQDARVSKKISYLSSLMQHPKYPRKRLLSAPYVLTKWYPEAISTAQACLRPDQCIITLVSQQNPGNWDKKEKWYGTEYRYEKFSDQLESKLNKAFTSNSSNRPKELHLPHQNEFIPTRLEVEKKEGSEPSKSPILIRNEEFVRTWFKKDDRFWVPKASLNVCLRSPVAYVTPRIAVMAQLFCVLVQDALNEYSYDAELAGLAYSLSGDALGLQITVSGYNDKMAILLEKVLIIMKTFQVKDSRFKIIKERFVRLIKNWGYKQPFHQSNTYRTWLQTERSWTNDHYAVEIATVEADDLRVFIHQILQQVHIETFSYGNLHKEDALHFTDLCERILKPYGLPQSQWRTRRSLLMPPSSNFIYSRPLPDPANINHCVELVLWAGAYHDRKIRTEAMLIAQLAEEPCYDQLRTKEQLGYVVFSSVATNLHGVGFRVLVQSEKAADYLEGRIESFLEQFGTLIKNMESTKFDKHKNSLLNRLQEKTKNMGEESDRLWGNIITEYFDFDHAAQDSAQVEKLTKQDILEFYENYISPTSEIRQKVSVHLVAQGQDRAAKFTWSEKLAALHSGLVKLLEEQEIPVTEALQSRIDKLSEKNANKEDITTMFKAYLTEDIELDEEDLDDHFEESAQLFDSALIGAGLIKPPELPKQKILSKIPQTYIEDVTSFKSGLTPTTGNISMNPASSFEENVGKL